MSKKLDIFTAIKNNDLERVKLLIQQNKKYVNIVYEKDQFQSKLLDYACKKNCKPEIIDLLLENGAKVDELNSQNETPLCTATKNNDSLEIVKVLVNHGANVNFAYIQKG